MGFSITRRFRIMLCGAMIAALSSVAFAQFKASLQGTVTDSTGAIVANATVKITNKDTNFSQTATASEAGFYRFSGLPPGVYRVAIEKTGFKKTVFENLTVNAEQTQGFDAILQAGVISEVVEVTTNEAPLQTEDANIRKTITTREIINLPQPGRDPYELARLAPGVFGMGARGAGGDSVGLPNTSGPGGSNNSIFATENVQPISANGQRVSSNNYEIDGTSVNSQTWGGGAVITPSQEGVKEVIVTSSSYSAEDGRNSGAQVKVVTNNGSNEFHGSAFFKIDDPSLNAFNTMPSYVGVAGKSGFVNLSGPQRDERKYKSYGGSLGGPIFRDKLFFFFTYEGLRENTENRYNSFIDTASFRQAVISRRPNTLTAKILAASGVEPRVVSILTPTCAGVSVPCAIVGNGMDVGSISGTYGTYMDPWNTGGGLDGIADLQYAQLSKPTQFTGNQFNIRLDYQLTNKDKLTFSSMTVPNKAFTADATAQSRPQADVSSKRLSFAYGLIYNRSISATMFNEARFNLTRWGYNEVADNPDSNLGLPRIEVEGIFGDRLRYGFPRSPNTPGVINEKQYDFRDALTNIRGNHVLKFGAEYRYDLNSNGEVGAARPIYSFLQQWNFANGTPIYEGIITNGAGKPAASNQKFYTTELAFFGQDDWKFRSNLTMNLGLRWDYFSPVTASGGVLGNLLLDAKGGLAGAKIVTNKTLYESDFNNFAPQLGFAWNPGKEGKLVIRGGGGIGFDRLPNALLANARRNPPNAFNFGGGLCCAGPWDPFMSGQIAYVGSTDGTITGYPANSKLGGVNSTTGLPLSGSVEIYGTPQKLPQAYVMRYSMEAQYQLPANLVGTIGYQGSLGRHFVRILPLNQMLAVTNPNLGSVYFASPDVNSNYNAMIARLQGTLGKQLSFDMNYRWAKSIDTASFESPCACTNQSFPVNQKEERGPSDFDVRHAYTASATWDVPYIDNPWGKELFGGWQVSAITTWNSGFPFTPRIYGCLNGNTSSSWSFCDPRPSSYKGTPEASNSNDNFLRQWGVFGVQGTTIFGTSYSSSDPFKNPPGIGRNRFVGPKYYSLDMAFSKNISMSRAHLGERSNLNLRFNFFNILNTLNLAPFNSLTDNIRVNSDAFGVATTGLSGRVGEFQIRFSF